MPSPPVSTASTGPIPKFDTQFYTADVPMTPFDVARANALLDGMGLTDTDGNGVRNFPAGTAGGADVEITLLANTDYATLAQNALRLTLAASWDDFAERAPLFHVHKQDVPQTAKAKDALRTESDQIVARLYGITPAEFAHKTKAASCTAHRH